MRKGKMLAAALALIAPQIGAPAQALDEDAARNILSSVFLAQSLAAVCAEIDPEFVQSTAGHDRDAFGVMTHIRDEILTTMTQDQAAPVLASAAGAARAVSLGFIRPLSGGSVVEQAARVKDFCVRSARPLVKGVVDNHELRHDAFLKMLKKSDPQLQQ